MTNILFNDDAKNSLIEGVNLIGDAVKTTFGPNGKNVIIKGQSGLYITKDGATVARYVASDNPFVDSGVELIKGIATKTATDVGDGPQPLYSKVLTPKGWTIMGDLKIGDKLCGTNKTIQEVVGIYPKGEKEIYNLKFSNGQKVECCEDHLWSVTTDYNSTKTLTTKQMFGDPKLKVIQPDNSTEYKYFINTTVVDFDKKDFVLDPYIVGLLIGDGSLSDNGSIELSLALDQRGALDDMILPKGIKFIVTEDSVKHYLRVKFSKIEQGPSMFDYVKQTGLFETKFIPKEYLYSDYESRIRLLKGLEVAGGHINKEGLLEYSTANENLCDDIVELLRGLGKQVHFYLKDSPYISTSPIYVISELKGDKHGIKLVEIEKTNTFTEMQCIKVSNPDHLYITNDYVITHNTTTASILAQALVNSLKDCQDNPISVARALDLEVKEVISYLEKNKRTINNLEDLIKVATVSTNNDEELGKLVAETYFKVTKDGVVNVEDSQDVNTTVSFSQGTKVESGYLSPFFINSPKGICELENTYVAIFRSPLNDVKEITPACEKAIKLKKSLLIIAPKIDSTIVRTLVINKDSGNLKSCCIPSPGHGIYRDNLLNDLENILGEEMFCDKVIVSKDSTTIIGGTVNQSAIDLEIENLQQTVNSKTLSEFEINFAKKRLANYIGGIATIHVGGYSQVEVQEKKDRLDDAICAVKAAMSEGVLPGGGVSLARASINLELTYLKDIILTPLQLLADSEKIVLSKTDTSFWDGINFKNMEVGDMYEMGIVDPFLVTKIALENAVSVASLILTNGCAIVTN